MFVVSKGSHSLCRVWIIHQTWASWGGALDGVGKTHPDVAHLAEVAIPLTVCLLLHGLGEEKWRRKRGQEMAMDCKVYSGHP